MPFKEEREKGPKPKDPRTTFALEAKGLNFLFDPKALNRGCFVVVYVSSWHWKNVKVGHLSRKPPPPLSLREYIQWKVGTTVHDIKCFTFAKAK